MCDRNEKADEVRLNLNADEAIILFDLPSRWINDDGTLTPSAQHFEAPSECAVLHAVLCGLEQQLVAPLRADGDVTLTRS